jgi:hypothetical protein
MRPAARGIGGVLLGLFLAGCSATPRLAQVAPGVADELFRQMQRRADPVRTRLMIHRIEPVVGQYGGRSPVYDRSPIDPGLDISQQLFVALSPRFNLVESVSLGTFQDPGAGVVSSGPDEAEKEALRRMGVTAIVVGEWAQVDRDEINASIRIVDVDTDLVLAAVRETYRFRPNPNSYERGYW